MIQLEDQETWPGIKTFWEHRNGNEYAVELFTNVETRDQTKYPTTIVYRNVKNGKMYSRPLMDWERSMKPAGGM